MRLHWVTTVCVLLLLASCGCEAESEPTTGPTNSTPTGVHRDADHTPPVLMPDLVGVPRAEAGETLGTLESEHRLGLSSNWGSPVTVRCDARPGTVAVQDPAPGTALERGTTVRIRTAALDLDEFRGPCEPEREPGPVTGSDAALARAFYRFAADLSLGAPFAGGDVWVGLENGPTAATLTEAERADLAAWQLGERYAERTGPFSALDVVAASGGYYELSRGVVATCSAGNDQAPPALAGLRSLSLTAPSDVTSACMQWWGVTLFLDGRDHIRGVALRLGSP